MSHLSEHGGLVTEEDLAGYRVIWRRPIRVALRGPSVRVQSASVLRWDPHRLRPFAPRPAARGRRAGERSGDRSARRGDAGAIEGSPGGASAAISIAAGSSRKLYSDASLGGALERIERREARAHEQAGAPGTTHISVVDERGNAASLTASTGSGSGVIVPGTGIHLNNMLGEYDLNPPGSRARPGARLTSMMAPSLVLEHERPRLVVGSAGSMRLRGAIMQIVDQRRAPRNARRGGDRRPTGPCRRRHTSTAKAASIRRSSTTSRRSATTLVRWRRQNLFFGGVSAVERRDDDSLAAAGDPRRGGHGLVVSA